MKSEIIFTPVSDNISKKRFIYETAEREFKDGHRVLILLPSIEGAKFVEELLWNEPVESFLPHIVSAEECKERVAITTVRKNINRASVLINLTAEAFPIEHPFVRIYEAMDMTSSEKRRASEEKRAGYAAKNFTMI